MYFVVNIRHLSSSLLQCSGCIFNKYWIKKVTMYLWVTLRPTPTPLCSDSVTLFSCHRGLQPRWGRSWHNKNTWKRHYELCLSISTFTYTHHKNAAHWPHFSEYACHYSFTSRVRNTALEFLTESSPSVSTN